MAIDVVAATHRITMVYQRLAKVFLICSEDALGAFGASGIGTMKDPRAALLNDLDLLLGDLCRDWGFCNRLSAAELVSSRSVLRDMDFAEAVLRAEKMNPEREPVWSQRIAERFAGRFGAAIRLVD